MLGWLGKFGNNHRGRRDCSLLAAKRQWATCRASSGVIEALEQRVLLSAAVIAQPNIVHVARLTNPVTPSGEVSPAILTAPYTPAQMDQAYGVNAISFNGTAGTGSGETIAIIDAYNDPDIISDTAAFNTQFGLQQFNVGGPTLTVLNQSGQSSPLPANSPIDDDWSPEESLDVQWAHSIAPQANIIVFETNSDNQPDLFAGAAEAAAYPGVSVVAMCFAVDEYDGEQSEDSLFTTPNGHQGVTFLAATGDNAAPAGYPAYSPNVVAVGGTTLTINNNGSWGGETGWTDSGGGISQYESQPSYQTGKVNGLSSSYRCTPDVSMNGDINTGVYIYDSFNDNGGLSSGWGGTSLACPMWAGLIAIANQGRALKSLGTLDGPSQTLPELYALPATDFHDITSGNNGYGAGPGYDLVTGLGSPVANLLVPALAGYTTTNTTHLVFAVQPPASVTAGNIISPALVVNIENASNQIITTDDSNVTLSVYTGPNGSTLLGTTTVAAVNGVATFNNLELTVAGNYTLASSDGNLSGGISSTVTVAPGAASQVVFVQQPSSSAIQTVIQPAITVAVEDSFGNVQTNNSSTVDLTIASGPTGAILSGNAVVQAVNGLATFSGISLNLLGNYTLQAIDGSLTAATSNSFAILPPAGQVFVADDSVNTIGDYNTYGVSVNAALISALSHPYGICVSGSDLFVVNHSNGTIGEYTTSGAVVNATLISGLSRPWGIAISGSDLFVTNANTGTVGEYTTSGATVNATLISGFYTPYGIAVSGTHLFVADYGFDTIGEYTTAGATVNAALVSSLYSPEGIAVSGSRLFEVNYGNNTIGEYTTSGGLINAALVSGLSNPTFVAVSGSDLFVVNYGSGTIGEYTTSGATVNAALISGLGTAKGIYVVGPTTQLVFGQQPTGTLVGGAIAPPITVYLEDPNGNLCSTDNSQVTLSVASGPGTLGGTVTVTAVNGVATFSNVMLSQAGNYTLQAGDSGDGLSGFVSAAFTITSSAAAKLVFTTQPVSAKAGAAMAGVQVSIENQYGIVETGDTSIVTLTGPGTLSGNTTVAAVAGVATFTGLSITHVGNYTFSVTDSTDGLSGFISGNFTISAAAPAKLVFTTQPANAYIGATLAPVVVTIEDQYGNVETGDTSKVSLSGPATLTGGTSLPAVAGVATFNSLSISQSGNYTFTAADSTDALSGFVSGSFTISGPHLAFTCEPSNVTAGRAIYPPMFVNVENAGGNTITSDNSTVTLSVASGSGTLGGTVTAQAVNGVAEFTNVMVMATGNFTLQATDGTDTPVTSTSFTVTAGTPTTMYRLFSPITKEHLYTTDLNEYTTLGTEGWNQESVAYTVYSGLASVSGVNDEPFYRLYNPFVLQHLWTTDANEYSTLATEGWIQEGIVGYVFPSSVAASTPLYRLVYPFPPYNGDLHLWTTNVIEYNTDINTYGWIGENIIGYVM